MSISRLGRWLPRCMARIVVVLLAAPNIASSQNRQRSCPTIYGGGTIRVHGFDVVFSAATDAQGTTLRALVLVRAPAEFLSRSFSADKAQQYLLRGPHGAGGNVGPLRIVHDQRTNVVWIDSLAIPLKGGSNLLLIDVDSKDSLSVVGQARTEPRIPIPPGPCDEASVLRRYHQVSDTLWARFQAIPLARSLVSR